MWQARLAPLVLVALGTLAHTGCTGPAPAYNNPFDGTTRIAPPRTGQAGLRPDPYYRNNPVAIAPQPRPGYPQPYPPGYGAPNYPPAGYPQYVQQPYGYQPRLGDNSGWAPANPSGAVPYTAAAPPASRYATPGYAPPPYAQPGYPQPAYGPPGYPPAAYSGDRYRTGGYPVQPPPPRDPANRYAPLPTNAAPSIQRSSLDSPDVSNWSSGAGASRYTVGYNTVSLPAGDANGATYDDITPVAPRAASRYDDPYAGNIYHSGPLTSSATANVSGAGQGRYNYDNTYRVLLGQLERQGSGGWKLRYIPIDGGHTGADNFGGSVQLIDTTALDAFRDGEFVVVEGRLRDQNSGQGYAPLYDVVRIDRQ